MTATASMIEGFPFSGTGAYLPPRPVKRALLIDSDMGFVRAAASQLRARSFEPTIASSKEQAAARLRAQTFDLVLLDHRLPDGNGLELVSTIDAERTRIAIITRDPSLESAVDAVRHAVFDYLIKPISKIRLDTLLERIDSPSRADAGPPPGVQFPIGTPMAEVERQMILATLQAVGHDKTRAARLLGVSIKTVYNKLARYRRAA